MVVEAFQQLQRNSMDSIMELQTTVQVMDKVMATLAMLALLAIIGIKEAPTNILAIQEQVQQGTTETHTCE